MVGSTGNERGKGRRSVRGTLLSTFLLWALRAQFYWRSLGDSIEGTPESFLGKGDGSGLFTQQRLSAIG